MQVWDGESQVVENASHRTPGRPFDWSRTAPFFAVVCSLFGWLKSRLYHDHGQLADERIAVLLFMVLAVVCVVVTVLRFRRYVGRGRWRLLTPALCAVFALLMVAGAAWNFVTAVRGAKDALW